MYKIIIVEDDVQIREELKILLENSGYIVEVIKEFSDVEEKILKSNSNLVLLDINLPGKDGYQICSKIRAASKIPIIFVTSRNNSMDELNGIMIGGDDYIEKPYNIPILLARIKNILNRTYPENKEEINIKYKEIVLNILDSTVSYKNNKIELSKTEFKILYFLIKNSNKIVSRIDIVEYMWDNQLYIDDNTLSVNITRIREKLSQINVDNLIETKRGQGYKLI